VLLLPRSRLKGDHERGINVTLDAVFGGPDAFLDVRDLLLAIYIRLIQYIVTISRALLVLFTPLARDSFVCSQSVEHAFGCFTKHDRWHSPNFINSAIPSKL